MYVAELARAANPSPGDVLATSALMFSSTRHREERRAGGARGIGWRDVDASTHMIVGGSDTANTTITITASRSVNALRAARLVIAHPRYGRPRRRYRR